MILLLLYLNVNLFIRTLADMFLTSCFSPSVLWMKLWRCLWFICFFAFMRMCDSGADPVWSRIYPQIIARCVFMNVNSSSSVWDSSLDLIPVFSVWRGRRCFFSCCPSPLPPPPPPSLSLSLYCLYLLFLFLRVVFVLFGAVSRAVSSTPRGRKVCKPAATICLSLCLVFSLHYSLSLFSSPDPARRIDLFLPLSFNLSAAASRCHISTFKSFLLDV